MPDVALRMDRVYKKFRRGEMYDSLRDLIPALTGRWARRQASASLAGREFWALQDVTFSVERGEAFGVIGPNGAGKSTMLKHLSGIMKPTQGSITVQGRLSALIEVGAGFHPDLTGRENIYLNGSILGMKRAEITAKFDDIVAFSGLEDFIDTPVKRYSSGMYARLGFSVAAHVEPDILVVDEVLSVGDWAFQQRCMEKMNEIIHGGATVIFVSHNLRAVSDLCRRSLLLDHGRVAQIGNTKDVVRDYLDHASSKTRDTSHKSVYVSRVTVRDEHGDNIHFEPGTRGWVDVVATARADCAKVDVKIGLTDPELVDIFNVSIERLGHAPVSLRAGQEFKCTFEVTWHLAPGRYQLYATLERGDTLELFDTWPQVASIYIKRIKDIRGIANLYPTVSLPPSG